MSLSVYIASPEGRSGKSSVAFGLVDLLSRRAGRIGVYRPVIDSGTARDPVTGLLIAHPGVLQGLNKPVNDLSRAVQAQVSADQRLVG